MLFALSTARITYTTHLAPSDPLNHGVPFTDSVVVELLIISLLLLLISPIWYVPFFRFGEEVLTCGKGMDTLEEGERLVCESLDRDIRAELLMVFSFNWDGEINRTSPPSTIVTC